MSITPVANPSIWSPATASPSAKAALPSSAAPLATGAASGSADPFQQLSSSLQATLLQVQGQGHGHHGHHAHGGPAPNSATSETGAPQTRAA